MDRELRNDWVAALRSGKYKQGTGQLKRYLPQANENIFCCLGVLCDVAGAEWVPAGSVRATSRGPQFDHESADEIPISMPPVSFLDNIGLSWHDAGELAHANDSEEYTFEQIAAMIEEMNV